jgi:hypothetical protein
MGKSMGIDDVNIKTSSGKKVVIIAYTQLNKAVL